MSSSGRFYRVAGKRVSEAEYQKIQAAKTALPKPKKSSTESKQTEPKGETE